MREFFVQNETIILFAQGLVFFSLGFAVWLQRRRATRLTLTSSLIWLAAFAFVEGFAEIRVAGVPLPWVILGVGVYPGRLLLGWLYVRRAERTERAFARLVQPGRDR